MFYIIKKEKNHSIMILQNKKVSGSKKCTPDMIDILPTIKLKDAYIEGNTIRIITKEGRRVFLLNNKI